MSLTKVILPKLGLTMDEGTIVAWHKKEGDRVTAGEAIFEVETDKVTMEVEAPATGYLRKIVVGDGETVPVATVIAFMADTLEEPVDVGAPASSGPSAPAGAASDPSTTTGRIEAVAPTGDRVAASPAARKRATELGVDLATVRGSGPGGRIQIEDIERAAADRSS